MSNVAVAQAAQSVVRRHPEIEDIAREFSDETGRPVRIVSTSDRVDVTAEGAYRWRPSHVGEAGLSGVGSRVEARDNGVTINLWASLSPRTSWGEFALPDGSYLYDVMQCAELLWDEIHWGSGVIGEFASRYIAFHAPMSSIAQNTEVPWDDILATPLRLSVDEAHIAALDERLANRDRDGFIRIAASRNETSIDQARSEIQEIIGSIRTYENSLAHYRRTLVDKRAELDARLAARTNVSEDDLLVEWHKLHEHRLIESAHLSGNVLHVMTTDIVMTDPRDGEDIPVGRFDLSLDFNANRVSANNLTMRRNGWDHPHVSNGDFCTGEMAGTVDQLLAERQIGAAVNLCLDALEHVNPEDSWGRNIVWWKEDEGVEPEPDYDE